MKNGRQKTQLFPRMIYAIISPKNSFQLPPLSEARLLPPLVLAALPPVCQPHSTGWSANSRRVGCPTANPMDAVGSKHARGTTGAQPGARGPRPFQSAGEHVEVIDVWWRREIFIVLFHITYCNNKLLYNAIITYRSKCMALWEKTVTQNGPLAIK